MAKSFKTNNPNDKLSGVKPRILPKKHGDDGKQKQKNGKCVGRPKTKKGNYKTINIAVEESIMEKLNIAKVCYGNNLTHYINKLIEKDMEENYDNYKHIVNSLNNLL